MLEEVTSITLIPAPAQSGHTPPNAVANVGSCLLLLAASYSSEVPETCNNVELLTYIYLPYEEGNIHSAVCNAAPCPSTTSPQLQSEQNSLQPDPSSRQLFPCLIFQYRSALFLFFQSPAPSDTKTSEVLTGRGHRILLSTPTAGHL